MILPIVTEPNVVLHRKAETVRRITADLHRLVADMIETMYAAQGVGLAANQINRGFAILVASPDGKKGKEIILLNPSIVKRRGKDRMSEGCLSLPGISAQVTRAAKVTARGVNLDGQEVLIEADGLLAKVLQHEVDHLEGHLFPERLSFLRKRQLMKKYAATRAALRHIRV